MSRPTVTIHNVLTDEIIVREMNDAEFAEWEQRVSKQQAEIAALAAKAAQRQAILDRLGLTADEAQLLLGSN